MPKTRKKELIEKLVKNLDMNKYNQLVEIDREMCKEMLNIKLPLRQRVSIECSCGQVRRAQSLEIHVAGDPHRVFLYQNCQKSP